MRGAGGGGQGVAPLAVGLDASDAFVVVVVEEVVVVVGRVTHGGILASVVVSTCSSLKERKDLQRNQQEHMTDASAISHFGNCGWASSPPLSPIL